MKSNRIRVFLVSLYPKEHLPFIGESQGICAISGYLKNKFADNIKVNLFDQQINSDDSIIQEINTYRPEIIGFSLKMGTLTAFDAIYNRIKNIQAYNPLFVVGNSIANFDGDFLLNKYPDLFVSFGEGELTFEDIVLYYQRKLTKDKIRNLKWNEDGVIQTSAKSYLDELNFQSADRRYSMKYYSLGGEVYVEGSRGCAYSGCSLCECCQFLGSLSKDKKWRPRKVEFIVEELEHLTEQGVHTVTFSDEDFIGTDIVGINHAVLLSDTIVSRGIKIDFRVNIRIKSIYNCCDDVNMSSRRVAMLGKLKQAGLVKVFLGFESGSQSQLRRYQKGFSLTEFLGAKAVLDDLNIDYELGYINFDPLMTLGELKETLCFINENNCITNISNVFKELRIQSGNRTYLNQIRKCEKEKNIKILADFDHNEQLYPVIKYADPKVDYLAHIMRKLESNTYKRYYSLRLMTQYSCDESNGFLKKTVFKQMRKIKNLCFDTLMSYIVNIEQNGIIQSEIDKIGLEYQENLDKIISEINSCIAKHSKENGKSFSWQSTN